MTGRPDYYDTRPGGPFRFGYNSEGIRNTFQNGFHDLPVVNTPRFEVLNRRGRWFWGFGGWW